MNGLIIFVKNPELGRCKTRLAKDIGDEHALVVYQNLLNHTRYVCSTLNNINCHLFYDKFIPESDEWNDVIFKKHIQKGEDLGAKMLSAFEKLIELHDKLVIIGSDCPELNQEIINEAFKALDNSDIVFGPSLDGGYYLLGMKKLTPELFDSMPWSTSEVLNSSIQKTEDLRLSYILLKTLSDLDNLDDLRKFPEFK